MAFTAGESNVDYLQAFSVDLFLTTSESDAQRIIDSNVCAAAVVKAPPQSSQLVVENQVRFAFDADAVIFNGESELINQEQGLEEFHKNEDKNQEIPLPEGPYAKLLIKLSKLKERLSGRKEFSPLKLAIITARNSPSRNARCENIKKMGCVCRYGIFSWRIRKKQIFKAI